MGEIRIYPVKWRYAVLTAILLPLLVLPMVINMDMVFMLSMSVPGLILVLTFGYAVFPRSWQAIAFTIVCILALIGLFFLHRNLSVFIMWSLPFVAILPTVIAGFGLWPILILNEDGIQYRKAGVGTIFTEWSSVARAELQHYKWGAELGIYLRDEQKVIDQYSGMKQRMLLLDSDDYGEPLLFTRIDMKRLKVDDQYLLDRINENIDK